MASGMAVNSSFIGSALKGGNGPSSGISKTGAIVTSTGLDNVKLAMDVESSLKDASGFGGGIENLSHSLKGTSAVQK